MEKSIILSKAQEIINEQFDKILKISIDENIYRIAIRRDQIPKIRNLSVNNNALIISFIDDEPKFDLEEEFYLKEGNDGKIETIFIGNVDKLHSESYRIKLNRKLLNFIKKNPETDKNKIMQKHLNKRIAHSVSEIIKTVPNSVYKK